MFTFAKCLPVSNNSSMAANNFSHFGFVFMPWFFSRGIFVLLSICFSTAHLKKEHGVNIVIDFLLVKPFRMQNILPLARKNSSAGIFGINPTSSRKGTLQNGRKVEKQDNPHRSVP